ncbi:MAG: hypothetical protein ACI4WQ_10430 [Sharpea porci]
MKKMQGMIFSLIMSYSMAIGMEVYNIAYKLGYHMQVGGFSSMHNDVFLAALKMASYMGIIVFIISTLYGNRLGQHLANSLCDQERSFLLLYVDASGSNNYDYVSIHESYCFNSF